MVAPLGPWRAVAIAALVVAVTAPVEVEAHPDEMMVRNHPARARELSGSVHRELTCMSCHTGHDGGACGASASCQGCHEEQSAQVAGDVHARVAATEYARAEGCVECHGSHAIVGVREEGSPFSEIFVSAEVCGRCHGESSQVDTSRFTRDSLADFDRSLHARVLALGDPRAATCVSCHRSHGVFQSSDPRASTHSSVLHETCGRCHEGARDGFASGGIHEAPTGGHFASQLVTWMYWKMIPIVVGLMLIHNVLDFFRRLRDRWTRSSAGVSVGTQDTIVRFTRVERTQHWVLAATIITLAATGFSLRFGWQPPGLDPEAWSALRMLLHRVAAAIFIALAVFHVGYLAATARGRAFVKAMLPRLRVRDIPCVLACCLHLGPPSVTDWRDLVHNVRYNLGREKRRPAFGRFTYAQKMEYLGLVWGALVMTSSGLMLWFLVPVLNSLPFWTVNLAATFHFYEGALAMLVIVVWHFYYVVWSPDVFPVSRTMFDGRMSLEELEREHAGEMASVDEAERGRWDASGPMAKR